MQKAAKDRDIQTCGTARMVTSEDFSSADMLITMDNFNFSELSQLAPDQKAKAKIKPFCDFVSTADTEVPDPYYGGAQGFEKVLDLLEDGCVHLLDDIQSKG
jgi:protein-tyrosine phosphatase